MKIYMLNPLNMTRFADLLYQGAIMQQVLQPFESHLQYLLQWMCDFNLYGCAYIDSKAFKFRHPVPDSTEVSNKKHKWHSELIKAEWISHPDEYPRQSHCSLEVDICVQDILNRNQVEMRDLHANFVERFGPVNLEEKLVRSLAGLWKDETRRRKERMGLSDDSSSPFPPEVLISMSGDPCNTEEGGWIHEEEYRDRVQGLIEAERVEEFIEPSFDDFVRPPPEDNSIRTVLESVEDLFPQNLRQRDPIADSDFSSRPSTVQIHPSDLGVNDTRRPQLDVDEFFFDSNEVIAREISMTQEHLDADKKNPTTLENLNGGLVNLVQTRTEEDGSWIFSNDIPNDAEIRKEEQLVIDHEAEAKVNSNIVTPKQNSNKRYRDELADAKEFHNVKDDVAPREKRRKTLAKEQVELSDGVNDQSTARPKSRHVMFDNPSVHGLNSRNSSQQKQSQNTTPASSQLSQGSIKATGLSPSTFAFPITKNLNGSQVIESEKMSTCDDEAPTKSNYTTKSRSTGSSLLTPTSTARVASTYESPETPTSLPPSPILNIASRLKDSFDTGHGQVLSLLPPSASEVTTSFFDLGYPDVIYQDPFYSNERDVPKRAREYAGREFKLKSTSVPFLPQFDSSGKDAAVFGEKPSVLHDPMKESYADRCRRRRRDCRLLNWEIAQPAPSWSDVEEWIRTEGAVIHPGVVDSEDNRATDKKNGLGKSSNLSQVDGPTQENAHGFKYSQKGRSTSVKHEAQYMSILSLEVHVNTRNQYAPNPEKDEVACIFWCIKLDDDARQSNGTAQGPLVGVLALSEDGSLKRKISQDAKVEVDLEETELDLINRMVDIVREHDPDILTGFEVHNGSWGYLMERARLKYDYDLSEEFSRMKSHSHGRFGKEADRWGFNTTSTIRVTGRHMINIWRAMRSELNLQQYTLGNVVFHVLHKRIPHYTFQDLTKWYKSDKPRELARCIQYFLSRVRINLEILEANDLVARTSEQARLVGVDFFSVFSRGSQFKVESFMFRIAKPENYLLPSPSQKQVGQQNALECLPLVMEPQSAFYNSPLVVLDFQSLYPSIMIAYNYCYSTCLGRAVHWRGQNKMGFADFKREPGLLELVKDSINIAPNGMMYVKASMRKSLLAKMLGEILETRVMVKSGMKQDKQDRTLQRLLNNRQLALKLLANVTYGYTSASFSGRMPCSEIADSIVQSGRETLEKAIVLIHSVSSWGADVVYGDTDSLFIHLKGRTREQAFTIGQEIADAVTKLNPRPVKLKFEKVYHPCVLLAKKRYVGFKYESPSQQEPEFDAKGIETVRRDGTPAEQKIEEKALKILFRTADLSQVKEYFRRECTKIMQGRVSIQDFCFAREVRLGTYADKRPPPPGALISSRRMLADPRLEPQYGERVPYVVVTGAPGARLIDRCVAPEALLSEDGGGHSELDADYYITKNLIPPLERIFNLVGANVRLWYDEMPKVRRIRDVAPAAPSLTLHSNKQENIASKLPFAPLKKQSTLESYFKSSHCVVCRKKFLPPAGQAARRDSRTGSAVPLCRNCRRDAATSLYALRTRMHGAQRKAADVERVCRSCAGLAWAEEVKCDSRDCPAFYSRVKERGKVKRVEGTVGWVAEVLERDGENQSLEW